MSTQSDAAERPTAPTPLEVARRYHTAWTQKDFEQPSRYLPADLQTDVPLNSYADAAEFLAGLAGFGQLVTKVTLLAELGDSHQAALLYDVYADPIGKLRVAEHFVVVDNHITHIRHVHDTAALRAAGFSGS